MTIRLDIGCGYNKKEGFIGIDKNPNCKPDIEMDITTKCLPYERNTVDEIYCDNLLEHLTEQEIEFVMQEFHRVIKQEGEITIRVPYKTSPGAYYWRHKTFADYYFLQDFDIKLYDTSFQIRHLPKFSFKRRLEFNKIYPWNYLFEFIFNIPKIVFIYNTTGLCFLFPARCVIITLTK